MSFREIYYSANFLAARRMIRERQAPDWMQKRWELFCLLSDCAEHGEVAVVTAGMDCDCSCWSGRVSILPANVMFVERWLNEFYDSAEGPQSHEIMRPSEARSIKSSSRDLALEAFEDGHAHVVYTA